MTIARSLRAPLVVALALGLVPAAGCDRSMSEHHPGTGIGTDVDNPGTDAGPVDAASGGGTIPGRTAIDPAGGAMQ